MGAIKSHHKISGQLFQLDLAAQSPQDDRSSTSRVSRSLLELARYCHLPHYYLTRDHRPLVRSPSPQVSQMGEVWDQPGEVI